MSQSSHELDVELFFGERVISTGTYNLT